MNASQSHANCIHPATKPARAKCRRARAKFADALTAALTETVEAPAPVFEPVRVTVDTWRDFRDVPVRIATQLDDETQSEHASGVKLSGWGKQWVNYINDEGKTKRVSVTCVRVFTVEA